MAPLRRLWASGLQLLTVLRVLCFVHSLQHVPPSSLRDQDVPIVDQIRKMNNVATHPAGQRTSPVNENTKEPLIMTTSFTNKSASRSNATPGKNAVLIINITSEDLVLKAWKLRDGVYHLDITELLSPLRTTLSVARPEQATESSFNFLTNNEESLTTELPSPFDVDESPGTDETGPSSPTNSTLRSTTSFRVRDPPSSNGSPLTLPSGVSSNTCNQQLDVYILHNQTLLPSQDLLVVREHCGRLIIDRIPYRKLIADEKVYLFSEDGTQWSASPTSGQGTVSVAGRGNIPQGMPDSDPPESAIEAGLPEPDLPLPCLKRSIRDVSSPEVPDHDCGAYETEEKSDFETNDDPLEGIVKLTTGTHGLGRNDTLEDRGDDMAIGFMNDTADEDRMDGMAIGFMNDTADESFNSPPNPDYLSNSSILCQPNDNTTCLFGTVDENAMNASTDLHGMNFSSVEGIEGLDDNAHPHSPPFHAIEFPELNFPPHFNRPTQPQHPIIFPSSPEEESTQAYSPERRPNTHRRHLWREGRGPDGPMRGGLNLRRSREGSGRQREPMNQTTVNAPPANDADSDRANSNWETPGDVVVGQIWREIVFPER